MKDRSFLRLCVISLLILASACAPRMMQPIEKGHPGLTNRVLIASQEGPFKEAVVSEVADVLEQHGCYVRIIDVRQLSGLSTETYQAIVLVNTCKAWRLNRNVRTFLKKTQDNEKVILLTTAGDKDWKPGHPEVDAITSASAMDRTDDVAQDIIRRVQTRLRQGQRS